MSASSQQQNAQYEQKQETFLSNCFAHLAKEEQSLDTENFLRLVVLSKHSDFRNKFKLIVSIPSAASNALKFIADRVANFQTQIRNRIGFEIAALSDYIKDHHNSLTLASYVSSPSDVSSTSSNSINSLLEENEYLRKRVKELESESIPVANTMAEFKTVVCDETMRNVVVSKHVATTLNKMRKRCKEQSNTLHNIENLAVSVPEFQICDSDSPETRAVKESANAKSSNMDTLMNIKLETQKKQDKKIISLQAKLKQSEEEKSALSKQVIEEKNALEDSKTKSKEVLEDVKTQFKSKVTELQEELYLTKDHFASQVRKEMETVHESDKNSIIRKHKTEVMQLKKQFQDLESVHEELEAEFECVCEQLEYTYEVLESEKIENKEHLGALDTLLTEDKPEAPSTGKKRSHDHIDKSSRKYLEECEILLQSEANKDIYLTPEHREKLCTEDLAGHKVPPRMKEMYEGTTCSFSKQVSIRPEAICEARETYIKEGVIVKLPRGQLGSSKKTVIPRLSFPPQSKSNECKTSQSTIDFLGSKLSNIPHSLRMTDKYEETLTVITTNQEPIDKAHDYVTKINEYRPKLNKEDSQILDDHLNRHSHLAEVAEKTQMKMIQFTAQHLGLVIIAEIDMRSIQHKELLGREDLIHFEGEDILQLKMPHPTAMKFSHGHNISVEQPLKVVAMLLDSADMLDAGITGDIVLERLLLCLDYDFHSEVFNVVQHRVTAHCILDALSMTYFTDSQKAEVKRRMSLAQKRRWRLLSQEERKHTRDAMSLAQKRRWRLLSQEERKHTQATRDAISKGNKGKTRPQAHRDAISKGNKGKTRTQAQRDAIGKASKGRKRKTKYHYRITNLDTKTILMEDCTLNEICDSNLGVKYNEPRSKSSFHNYLNVLPAGSTSLDVSDVEYRVEKYLVTK